MSCSLVWIHDHFITTYKFRAVLSALSSVLLSCLYSRPIPDGYRYCIMCKVESVNIGSEAGINEYTYIF